MDTTQARESLPEMNTTVAQMFIDRVAKTPDKEAFRKPTAEGGWQSYTWKETYEASSQMAAGLIAIGLEPEQRVGIASGTRLDWILADLAIMLSAGAGRLSAGAAEAAPAARRQVRPQRLTKPKRSSRPAAAALQAPSRPRGEATCCTASALGWPARCG